MCKKKKKKKKKDKMNHTLLLVAVVFLIACPSIFGWRLSEHDRVLREKHLSVEWIKVGSAPSAHQVVLKFWLRNANWRRVDELTTALSDPNSELYGLYLSLDEVASIVAPEDHVQDALYSWLQRFNVASLDTVPCQDVFVATFNVADAERMLGVRFSMFEHRVNGRRLVRTMEAIDASRVPELLHDELMLVQGVHDFVPTTMRKGYREPTVASSASKKRSLAEPKITGLRPGDRSFAITFEASAEQHMLGVLVAVESAVPTIRYASERESVPTCSRGSCRVTFDAAPEFVPLKVSMRELYANASSSATVRADYPVVVTPFVVPKMLQELYTIPRGARVTNSNCTISVVEFEQQYTSSADLAQFFAGTGIEPGPVTFVGPNDQSNPGGEANLDIQQMMAMAPGAPMTFWSIKADSTAEIDDMLTWLYQLGNTTNPPLVNSASYGMTSQNVDKYLGPGYLAASLKEFQKQALRGLTIVIASGDTGSFDLGPAPMSAGSSCDVTHPDWPSLSPYVVSVSSTYMSPMSVPLCYESGATDCLDAPLGEVAVSVSDGRAWTGGGGFAPASISPRPAYQNAAAAAYLSQSGALPPASSMPDGNSNGRIYPDLTSIGADLLCVVSGQFIPISGSSASAPISAGILALLNNDLLNAGCPQLGFANPMLYELAESSGAFNDVTVGSNRCGSYGFEPVCCSEGLGYQAVPGFDAVSGLGSFDYSLLRAALLAEDGPCHKFLARHNML
jgi:tripeptidyl-peptidase I